MKKIVSLILAMLLVFSLATVAAAENDSTIGSINITGVSLTEKNELLATYTVYKLMDLRSFEGEKYSYQINPEWRAFFNQDTVKAYFSVDSSGYAKWVSVAGENQEARAVEFAQLAIDWAKNPANGISYERVTSNKDHFDLNTETKTVSFNNLELGYYLVDSSVGALCGLTTTDPTVTMETKNAPPVVTKKVQEDSLIASGTSSWGSSNTAGIGEVVNFDSTIEIETGAQKLIYHDIMDEGLTFREKSVVVKVLSSATNTSAEIGSTGNYTLLLPETEGFNTEHDCTFEIQFTDDFCRTLKGGDKVIILYSAQVNENAVIGSEGNSNEGFIQYGDNHTSSTSSTTTKLYEFDLLKVDSNRQLLEGAIFQLYNTKTVVTPSEEGQPNFELSDIIKFVKEINAEGRYVYRVATPDEMATAVENIELTDGTDGYVIVSGLDNGTYYLYETVAPQGYDKLTNPVDVIIADSNYKAQMTNGVPNIGSGIQIINNTGVVLPSTGAMGTTMFIFFGMFAVLATGVLLVTKKRMSMIED